MSNNNQELREAGDIITFKRYAHNMWFPLHYNTVNIPSHGKILTYDDLREAYIVAPYVGMSGEFEQRFAEDDPSQWVVVREGDIIKF